MLIRAQPSWESMPVFVRGVCDCQFCAVALMLVGYSLETCLKAMLIITHGVGKYLEDEKRFQHHRLDELSNFIPLLSEKEKAILKALSHFTYWAGRCPDPGSKRTSDATEIFSISESFQSSGNDLFKLATKVMGHLQSMTEYE